MLCRNAFAQGDACIECRCEQPGGKRISHGEARTPRITAELVGSEFGGKLPEMKKRFRRRHFGQIRQIEQITHKAPRRVELLARGTQRSEEHKSELQSLLRTSYADFCLYT